MKSGGFVFIDLSNEQDISLINSIIECSKRYWDYSEDYLKAAIPLIQIDAKWLHKNRGYSIFDDDELVGFLGVQQDKDSWVLDHLWISPGKIRTGLGSKAVDFIVREAQKANITKILLLPDPLSEGFYLRKGAHHTGKVVQSRVKEGPLFQEMVFEI